MKKVFSVIVFVVMFVFVTSAFAAEEEKEEGWKPYAEISAGVHNKYVEEYSGALYFNKAMSNQSVMVGLDKDGTGIYLQAENFSPFDREETEETDFYAGAYAKIYGVKFDIGYGRYWIREVGEVDFNGVYAEVTFPAPFWGIVPFIKGEYRFAEKIETENGEKVSLDGFVYYGGLSKEFEIIPERLKLTLEASIGGHTGIYNMPAENLSFAREKIEIEISLTEWLKLKASALTQQNLGKEEGIAADTEEAFVSGALVFSF